MGDGRVEMMSTQYYFRVTISVMKQHNQRNLGREGRLSLGLHGTHLFIMEEVIA